jgi:diaminohydroxyphosphoribosylaminopyrimidine deaminase/5-amino-6-(5-phosphoribosylamino)uracil reductase
MNHAGKSADEHFMRRALELAVRGAGRVSPNPMVGCVIVRGGRVIAEGWHKRFGGDHAEIVALKRLCRCGDVSACRCARAATWYVTLEPCGHFGKTPPCVDAVIAARPGRVVIALKDPNPQTCGRSIRRLRRKGIRVDIGVGAAAARELNRCFIKFITQKSPYVIAKVAQSLDGKIAARVGKQSWLSGLAAQRYVQRLRSQVDAVMVGRTTVAIDDPRLNVRNARRPQPKRVILDSRLRTSTQSRIFKTSGGAVILVCTLTENDRRVQKFRCRGVTVLCLPARSGRISLTATLQMLADRGIASVLCEGGAKVFTALRRAGLADEWHLIITPRLIGKKGVPAFTGDLPVLTPIRTAALGVDLLVISRPLP